MRGKGFKMVLSPYDSPEAWHEQHPQIAVAQPTIYLTVVCHTCRKYHEIRTTPLSWLTCLDDWQQKHPMPTHYVDMYSPKRTIPAQLNDRPFWDTGAPWWLDEYAENVDIKLAYASSAAYTISFASLATSSTLVAGRNATAISNTSNLYLDYLVGGKITVGTTPTAAKAIQIWLYGSIDDTPTYADSLTGTDAAFTWTSVDVRNAGAAFFNEAITTDTTSNRAFWYRPMGIAPFFGGRLPKNHSIWVSHETAVNLNSTAGNHVLSYTGVYVTG